MIWFATKKLFTVANFHLLSSFIINSVEKTKLSSKTPATDVAAQFL